MSEADYEQLSIAIENARQKPNESVSNFIPRMRRMLLLLTPNLPREDQLRQLKIKLRPEYKQFLAFSNPQTIPKLRQVCLKIEARFANRVVKDQTNNQHKDSREPRDGQNSHKQEGAHYSGAKRYNSNRGNKNNRDRNDQSKRTEGGSKSYQPRGYQARRSPSPRRNDRNEKDSKPRENQIKADVQCYNCGKNGH